MTEEARPSQEDDRPVEFTNATPEALLVAEQLGMNIAGLKGPGPDQCIMVSDIWRALGRI